MSLESFLIKHRIYCELCSAPIPATKVVQIRRRPQWPETKTVVVCDAHWRANSPIEAGLKERITKADIQTTGEKIPYLGHMRKKQ